MPEPAAVPAEPHTVALYVAALAGQAGVATIERRLAANSVAHQMQGLKPPTRSSLVRTAMQGITEEAANKVGAITTSGQMTEFAVPTAGSFPEQIAQGSHGAMWFTEGSGSAPGLGRIDLTGVVSEFASPTPPSTPQGIGAVGIALGPDDNIWFTEIQPNTIIQVVITG